VTGVDADPGPERPWGWDGWYRFARDELGYAHDESAEYANRRYVEERNRDALRGESRDDARPAGA